MSRSRRRRHIGRASRRRCADACIGPTTCSPKSSRKARLPRGSETPPIPPDYLRLSLLYQADCLFDLGLYGQALPLYEEAGWKYHDTPSGLTAYIQIINCHLRLGRHDEAVTALKRAKQLAEGIPQEQFIALAGGRDRARWQEFLRLVEDSSLFRRPDPTGQPTRRP